MPNAPETRRYDRHSGTSKIDAQRQMINLFDFPSLYDLGEIAAEALKAPGSRGRRSHYPATVLLAVAVAARATASLPEACRLLRGQTWEECRKRYYAFTEGHLPDTPPSRDAVFYFMEKLADNDEVRARLHEHSSAPPSASRATSATFARGSSRTGPHRTHGTPSTATAPTSRPTAT